MSLTNGNNDIKSPKLQGSIVEYILLSCINGVSICEISFEMQRICLFHIKHSKSICFIWLTMNFCYMMDKNKYMLLKMGDLIYWTRLTERKRWQRS